MKPFLRPVDRGQLAPVGWEAEPAGLWKGREVDVVYDPNRHRVLVVRGDLESSTETALRADGWTRQIQTADNSLWVCDEVELAKARIRDDLADMTAMGRDGPQPSQPELGGIA